MRATGFVSMMGLSLALAACSAPEDRALGELVTVAVPPELMERHDFSLADTPNKRIALAYLYTAWNDGEVEAARRTYWVPGSFTEENIAPPPNVGTPSYTIHKVIEEGDHVVVLAFVEGVGIGEEFSTVFGTPGGTKIGDAVVEIMRFSPDGLIAEKWDTIEPLSEDSYDFR